MSQNRAILFVAAAVALTLVAARLLGSRGALYAIVAVVCAVLIFQWLGQPRVHTAAARPPSDEQKRWQAYREEVITLPLEEARRRTYSLLKVSALWECRELPPDSAQAITELPSSVRELLAGCGVLHARHADARIGGDAVAHFDWPGSDVLGFGHGRDERSHRFRRIGIDFDNNPLLVLPGDEKLYVVHRPESNPARWWSSEYPSVYHWLLLQEFKNS